MREVSESVFDYDFHVLAEISVDVHSQERTVQNHMPESVFEIIMARFWQTDPSCFARKKRKKRETHTNYLFEYVSRHIMQLFSKIGWPPCRCAVALPASWAVTARGFRGSCAVEAARSQLSSRSRNACGDLLDHYRGSTKWNELLFWKPSHTIWSSSAPFRPSFPVSTIWLEGLGRSN